MYKCVRVCDKELATYWELLLGTLVSGSVDKTVVRPPCCVIGGS